MIKPTLSTELISSFDHTFKFERPVLASFYGLLNHSIERIENPSDTHPLLLRTMQLGIGEMISILLDHTVQFLTDNPQFEDEYKKYTEFLIEIERKLDILLIESSPENKDTH